MALIAPALAQDMIDATLNAKTADIGLTKLGNAIGKYVTDNAKIIFSWVAFFVPPPPAPPTPVPDPTVVANGELKGFMPVLTKSMATTQQMAMIHLANELKTAMMSAQAMITDAGFSTSPVPMASAPAVSSLVLNINGTSREDSMLQLATQICSWVQSCVAPTPSSGVHMIYTVNGIGTMTSIL